MNTEIYKVYPPSSQDVLNSERPWPGLAAYTEADSTYFFGRDAEAEDLTRRIRRERLTVLFGQSGLGKTSLLKAGLFPRLRAADLQPIYLRLDYTAQAKPLSEQVLDTISAAIIQETLDAPLPNSGEDLWAYFHKRDLEWWSPRNRLLTPVLVFDQFEEIFTLGRTHLQASQIFLDELADLIENRRPEQVSVQSDFEEQDNSRVYGKLLLSFREDFLPDFESLKGRIHSLFLNRVRLERLNGSAACSVLQNSGGRLLAPGLADDIVRFVAAEKKPRPMLELTVEPALLSVVCRELNERRISRLAEHIGADMLELGQHEILRDLVGRALINQPAALIEGLEEHLLTDGDHRAQYPLQDLIQRAGVGQDAIYALVTQRILRVEPRAEVEWVELTHDLLAPVVRENRDRRRAAFELERNRRKMRRMWAFAGVMVVLLVGMAGLSWQMFRAREDASLALAEVTRQKSIAEYRSNEALIAKNEANQQRELVDVERLAALAAKDETLLALKLAEARRNEAVAAQYAATKALDEMIVAQAETKKAQAEARKRQNEAAKRLDLMGSIWAFASAPGQAASDGVGRNGLYTGALLAHIENRQLSINEVFLHTHADVANLSVLTRLQQRPELITNLNGDIFLYDAPPTRRSFALLVGNAEYRTNRLLTPTNDARDMEQVFKKMGVETITLLNADRASIKKALRELINKLKEVPQSNLVSSPQSIVNHRGASAPTKKFNIILIRML